VNLHGRRYVMGKGKGMWKAKSVKRTEGRGNKGHARVEEPLVLAAGKVIEVFLDSSTLPVRSGKLCFSMVNTIIAEDQRGGFKLT